MKREDGDIRVMLNLSEDTSDTLTWYYVDPVIPT